MRVRLSALFLPVFFVAGCLPDNLCSGTFYYDPDTVSCRPCPKGATFKDRTCMCKDQYTFVHNKCMLMDGAVIEVPDAGPAIEAGMSTAKCSDYCDFAKVCIGDSALAKAALADIVSGLHADAPAACTSSCMSDLGGDGSSDPVVACVEAGRAAAACAGDSTQAGLGGAIGLLGDCCRPRMNNALCKSICKPFKANVLVSSMVDFCP